MSWMTDLLKNFTSNATANRQDSIAFAAGDALEVQKEALEQRRNEGLGALGTMALIAGGYLIYRWLKQRGRRG